MNDCTNNLTPIIVAIAGVITVQVPLIITHALNNVQARHDARQIKRVTYDNNQKLDKLEYIARNGFYHEGATTTPPAAPGEVEINPPIE